MPEKMTDEQRDQAARHEHLIGWYMRIFHLKDDDWYGVIAVALCEACIHFDPRRGSFEKYARKCAANAVISEYRYQKIHCPPAIQIIDENEIASVADTEAYIGTKAVIDSLPAAERRMLWLRAAGKSDTEISALCHLSYNQTQYLMRKARMAVKDGLAV